MRIHVLALLLPLAACGMNWSDDDGGAGVPGTGAGNTRSYAVTGFTAIDQRGPDNVDVRVGSGFSVRAEGDPDVLDRVKIVHDGQRLRISRTRSSFGWSSGAARIFVTMPRIESASLAGSGDIAVDRIDGAAFAGNIAGAGSLSLGRVAVESLQLSIAGAGNVSAAGEVQRFSVSIAGSGDVDAAQLRAGGATIKIAGAGGVRAAVDGDAKVSIMGAGDVDLGPKARCKVDKMGGGDVRCGG